MRIFVAALIFLYPHIMLANDWRGVYQSSVESIPFIDSAGATCSGVLVSEDRILTAWHCVGLMRSIKVKWKATDKADEREAVTIYKDEDHDIAILKLNSPVKRRSLLLANSGSAQEGLPICTIGHPMSRDEKANLAFSISAGVISKINKDNMVTDMSVSPGNSGGPVLTSEGKILAVVSQKYVGARIGNVAILSQSDSAANAVAVSKQKQTPLSWMDAKNTWYLYIPAAGTMSIGKTNDLNESSTKKDIQEYHLEWRARDRISIGASWGGNNSVSTGSFTVGFNLPLPEFNFSVGAFVGPRMVERSEEKKQKYSTMAGMELSAYRSIFRLRGEHSIAAERPLSVVTASVDLLSLF